MKFDNYYATQNYTLQCYSYQVAAQNKKKRVDQDAKNTFWAKARYLFNSLMSQK